MTYAAPSNRATLIRRGLWLEYATMAWNVAGVLVVAIAAWRARSVALAGFGLDSLIEIFASVVVVWQLTDSETRRPTDDTRRSREEQALRLIAWAFLALAAYVAMQIVYTVATRGHPAPSRVGMVWLLATFVAMLGLAAGKRRFGMALGNPVLTAEARVTMVDAYLAGSVLIGLALNALVGWWWADPLSAMVLVYYGAREGRPALAKWRA